MYIDVRERNYGASWDMNFYGMEIVQKINPYIRTLACECVFLKCFVFYVAFDEYG